MFIRFFVIFFLVVNALLISGCAMVKNEDVSFMRFDQKHGYVYKSDGSMKTALDGFLDSGRINNVRLSDANENI